ncbi:hypothetical protein DOM22_05295 [Bdellovibrio sp. ZAP7]|uniref:hypothetical protein n=1 Tax=Bdellovibrio sp. ZAP7 TaxID=2231053 RepID=UPI00115A2E45|nr:hypothetical protein [Bdellovibrio sp. ZAP7]QDK44616.1 hypothetical protein DOM22_05295 [Bdellovibrio sp. ZAP7]
MKFPKIDIQFIYRNFFPGTASIVVRAKGDHLNAQDRLAPIGEEAARAITSWFISDALPLFHTESDLVFRRELRDFYFKVHAKKNDEFCDQVRSCNSIESLLIAGELIDLYRAVPNLFIECMAWDDSYPYFEFPEDFEEPKEWVGKEAYEDEERAHKDSKVLH